MKTWGILTDVTKCIGCESCVAACKKRNKTGEDRPWPWQHEVHDLSATRWTTVERLGRNRYVRRQCRHCEDPACASACPVGAMHKTREGPVVYDSGKCMGCRYCMMACPFHVPRYSYDSATPVVRKCVMCHDWIVSGKFKQPACTEACPTGATVFGERDELLELAKRRVRENPGRYLDHVYGETEAGGTSVLNVTDVPIEFPAGVPNAPLPDRTQPALIAVPFAFVGMGVAMVAFRFIIGRRDRLREEAALTHTREQEDAE